MNDHKSFQNYLETRFDTEAQQETCDMCFCPLGGSA